MASGIYEIINKINGHRYVGSAVDISGRWRTHKSDLNRNKHQNTHLQRAWKKYGEDNFKFQIIEHCFPFVLISREQYWIDKTRPEYNILPKAGNSLGFKHTSETLVKMSNVQKGRKHSEETRRKMSLWQTGLKRPSPSKETLDKLSKSHKGKKPSAETLAKRSLTLKSVWQNYSPEQRRARADRLKGKKISQEQRAKLSLMMTGRKASPETIAKISEAGKGRKHSPETRAKMSASNLLRWAKRKEKQSD